MTDFVKVDRQDRICTITLNRPDVMNALNHQVFVQLREAIKQVGADAEVGCVILRGEGRAFSAGHDLNDIAGGDELEHADFEATTLEALASLPKPVICEVQGYCFTGALELALAADLIFVADNAKLADTHSKWGLSPVWGMTQRLPRRVGVARAKDMMFSSRLVPAAEALEMGLVDRVFDADRLSEEVLAYARTVVENSSDSHRVCKTILEATDGLRIHDGLDYEYTNSPGACADMQERVDRFVNKSN